MERLVACVYAQGKNGIAPAEVSVAAISSSRCHVPAAHQSGGRERSQHLQHHKRHDDLIMLHAWTKPRRASGLQNRQVLSGRCTVHAVHFCALRLVGKASLHQGSCCNIVQSLVDRERHLRPLVQSQRVLRDSSGSSEPFVLVGVPPGPQTCSARRGGLHRAPPGTMGSGPPLGVSAVSAHQIEA